MTDDYDLLLASDLRLPGGTTASMAEEIRAQAAVGYRTALLHVPSGLANRGLGIDPRLRRLVDEGLADLIAPGQRVSTRLAVLRNATVFSQVPVGLPVSAESVAMIANHVALDAARIRHYEPAVTDAAVTAWLGVRPTWYPIGPAVRESLEPDAAAIDLAPADWFNLLDVAEWAADRAGVSGRRPVIGRHSRSSPAKWPESAHDLLAVYPEDGSVQVRVLGGAAAVGDVLGRVPSRWIVEEFGARNPRDFVAELDFFVYFHRSDLVEAYGRTIMEAMASGAVAILPEHFRETFGDAARYASPDQVQPLIAALAADDAAYLAQSRTGQEFVRRTHGHQVHVDRLARLIGEPSGPARGTGVRRRPRQRSRVLFVNSNGAGMGHLTRLLAMAERSSDAVEPMFFSMSQAVPVVEQYGYPWEYCPSRGDLGCSVQEWNPLFAERFAEVLRRYRPQAVVFDGTMPYVGMVQVRPAFPDTLFVWSRRGMWRAGTTPKFLARGSIFDLVIQPGEVAAEADHGPTSSLADARVVGPVTLLDESDLLDRDAARMELGLTEGPALLISLGAGAINDLTSDLGAFTDAAAELPGGWQTVVARPAIAGDVDLPTHVVPVSVFPLSRYLRAFDACVVAAGYNSFHEAVLASVPAAFVPNLETTTDDQLGRARWAADRGLGVSVPEVTPETARAALAWLADPSSAVGARAAADAVRRPNGAGEAIRIIESALAERGLLR